MDNSTYSGGKVHVARADGKPSTFIIFSWGFSAASGDIFGDYTALNLEEIVQKSKLRFGISGLNLALVTFRDNFCSSLLLFFL